MIVGMDVFATNVFANTTEGEPPEAKPWVEMCKQETIWTEVLPIESAITRCEDNAS